MSKQIKTNFLVVMANELIKQPQDLSLIERRALFIILSKLKPRIQRNPSKDLLDRLSLEELKEFYHNGIDGESFTKDSLFSLTVQEYSEIIGVRQCDAREELKQIAFSLGKRQTILQGNISGIINWTSTSLFKADEDTLFIKFNELLIPYLCNLQSHFTKIRLKEVLLLQSTYSWRFYEIYKMRQGENMYIAVQFTLEELYEMLDVPPSRREYRKFNERILKPDLKELKEKGVLILQVHEKKLGKKVVELGFERATSL